MNGPRPAEEREESPVGVIALVLLIVAGFALVPWLFSRVSRSGGPLQDNAAPDFTLPVILNANAVTGASAGKAELTLSEQRGSPVVLDFWASWCQPCRMEAPIVNRAAQRFRDRGLVVLGVNADEDPDDGKQWAITHNIGFPIVHDGSKQAANGYRISNLPTLVVIGRDGKVAAVRSGVTDAGELDRLIGDVL